MLETTPSKSAPKITSRSKRSAHSSWTSVASSSPLTSPIYPGTARATSSPTSASKSASRKHAAFIEATVKAAPEIVVHAAPVISESAWELIIIVV